MIAPARLPRQMPPQLAGSASASKARTVWLCDPWCFTPWYTAELARALLAADVPVRLVCPPYHPEPDFFKQSGLRNAPGPCDLASRLHPVNPSLRRAIRVFDTGVNLPALAAALILQRPAVLHLQQCPLLEHGIITDLLLVRWARRLSIPVVHTVHNLLPNRAVRGGASLYKRFYQACDRLICHSPDTAERLAAEFLISPGKIDVIPHGPLFARVPLEDKQECRSRLGIPAASTVFLMQGVLAPYKGAPLLLEAWRGLQGCMPGNPLLVIAGTGPLAERDALRKQVHQLGLTSSVRLILRYISSAELPFFYQAADVLLYPYERITTSGALMTGLQYAKPVIASDLPAFQAVLDHGVNALLLPAYTADALTEGMAALLRSPALMRHLEGGARFNAGRCMQWPAIGKLTLKSYLAAGAVI